MAEQKTRPGGNVDEFLAGVVSDARRADSRTLIAMMGEVTGEPAVLWGTMIGFGHYHYKYASGHEGDAFLVGFAPRKAEFSIYVMGCNFPDVDAERIALLARLGKHRMGKGCLYVRKLADIDLAALRELAELSVRRLREAYPAAQ